MSKQRPTLEELTGKNLISIHHGCMVSLADCIKHGDMEDAKQYIERAEQMACEMFDRMPESQKELKRC